MSPLHNKLVAHLLATFAAPGAGDASDKDGDALADVLATAADLQEAIAAVTRSALADEIMASRIGQDIKTLQARKSRLEVRADRKREVALATMIQAGEGFARIEAHDVTASLSTADQELFVEDQTVIPAEFFATPEPKLKRAELRAALKAGADILGATLLPGRATLRISSK